MHYNEILRDYFCRQGYNVVYQPSCFELGYDGICWNIRFPEVKNWNNTIVILHCPDFFSFDRKGCTELRKIEKHYGEHADQIVVVHWCLDIESVYHGPLKLIYFPTHSYELLSNLKNDYDNWIADFNYDRPTVWQCLNGVTRSHRRLVAEYLIKRYHNGILSLGEEIPLENWSYQTYFGCENEINWQRLRDVYSNCAINIVTETQYYEYPGIITEKTLFAFLAQQVPIVIGYKGIVKHIEDLGFDMFRDIVDTTYDNKDNEIRWQSAIDKNSCILQKGINLKQLENRLQRNLKHAMSLPKKYIRDYEYNCKKLLKSG